MVRTLAREAVGEGALDRHEAQFIDQIFDFGNKTIEDIMTPRSDIFFLSLDMPLKEIITELSQKRHTKVPIYQERRDNVCGILHARDLLGKGDIQPVEMTMIQRIFTFSETTAYEVMVPLIDVVAIEQGAACGQALDQAHKKAHVRLLVYNERVDKVVGVLNALELLDVDPQEPIQSFVHEVRFVPASKNISELLIDLRKDGDTVAVVVDEFGGAEGLVTIEDIMEEVVEEMQDEYDVKEKPSQWVRKISKKDYRVSARIEIDTFEEELGIRLPKGKYATLGGFLIEKAGEVPDPGTVVRNKGITFTIERSTPQAIQEVSVRL